MYYFSNPFRLRNRFSLYAHSLQVIQQHEFPGHAMFFSPTYQYFARQKCSMKDTNQNVQFERTLSNYH